MSTEYNLGAVRRLLMAAFTAEELPRFCRDRADFEPACDRFGPRYGLDDMVDELLEYARTHRLLGELLAAVREVNPRQYAAFAPQIEAGGVPSAVTEGAGAATRAWLLLGLLALDLGLLVLGLWCDLGRDPALRGQLWTEYAVIGVLTAALAAALTLGRPVGWADVRRVLGTRRKWTYVIGLFTVACLAVVNYTCLTAPPVRRPTTYLALIVDNGPVPGEHDFDELRGAVREEVAHALPNAALALRVFGAECGRTRRLVDFRTGNAGEVAEVLGGVVPVAQADLTEAVRQALDDLLAQPGTPPRVLVVVTWGREGCGGDLNAALDRYREQLGRVVSLTLVSVGGAPALAARPGVAVVTVDDVEEARDVLHIIHGEIESGTWSPGTPPLHVTPGATP